MMKITIINGPNLNLLGRREPDLYGTTPFDDYLQSLQRAFPHISLHAFQSNHEGALIDAIQRYGFEADGLILNAGAYTHTSLALADAIRSIPCPVVEVHLTNVFAREAIRRQSLIAPACRGVIAGFSLPVYRLALEALLQTTHNTEKSNL